MSAVSADMVKTLRVQTGAGMMDCKSALTEANGDMNAAADLLRQKGQAKAARKAGRATGEGLIGIAVAGTHGAAVEVNSETDFVARNDVFQDMVRGIANVALTVGGDLDSLLAAPWPGDASAGNGGGTGSVAEHVSGMIASIGENMSISRAAGVSVGEGVVASYIHNQAGDGLGRIGVLVGLESGGPADALMALGRKLAMHVAAAAPLAVSADDLDPDVVERERKILLAEAVESGKPEEIAGKIVDGRMKKFHRDVALLSQTFVLDGESSVADAIEAAKIGAPVKIAGFVRLALGEGAADSASG